MNDNAPTSYDIVPYVNRSFPQSNPNKLWVVARLFGLNAPHPGRCRVLELGCGRGGNIVPMAFNMPHGEFAGIDLSAVQVAEARKMADKLGLSNLRLEHKDLMDVDEDFGQFDYIIAHGVFSWAPGAVRAKLLSICKRNLAPDGVAYVSYNTYPGWRMRQMLREMMLYHVRDIQDPGTRVRQARALVQFLADSVPQNGGPYEILLKEELGAMNKHSDAYLYHDHLEEQNVPLYFHEFIKLAGENGLKYLGESDVHTMAPNDFRPGVQEQLRLLGTDIVRMEQYIDFLRNRRFRQTLLCHKERELQRKYDIEGIKSSYISTSVLPVSAEPEIFSGKEETFKHPVKTVNFTTRHPLFKATFAVLKESWPQAVAFDWLYREAYRRLADAPRPEDRPADRIEPGVFARELLGLYLANLLELHAQPFNLAVKAGDRPQASLLARMGAEYGNMVANQRFATVNLETEFARAALKLLDGECDRAGLTKKLAALATDGGPLSALAGDGGNDPSAIEQTIARELDAALATFASLSLLVD
ncbi:MAG: methyltransferase regulatory domain-containing protein [Nitrospinae bacterium]|nr:methyltransferase regulatory domain-containing protein [Nitrospinota bacterium]